MLNKRFEFFLQAIIICLLMLQWCSIKSVCILDYTPLGKVSMYGTWLENDRFAMIKCCWSDNTSLKHNYYLYFIYEILCLLLITDWLWSILDHREIFIFVNYCTLLYSQPQTTYRKIQNYTPVFKTFPRKISSLRYGEFKFKNVFKWLNSLIPVH